MKISITRNSISKLTGIFFWLVLWQLFAMTINNINLVPTVFQTFNALLNLMQEPTFLPSIMTTLGRVFLGFGISCFLGIFFGVLSGLNHWIHDIFKPIVQVFRATPVISVIIIVGLWVHSELVPVVIAFLMCFPIVWTNACVGIKETDYKLLEMAKCFHVSKKAIMKGVYLPSVKPYLIAGITTAFGISWKVTVAAEVLSFPRFAIGKKLYESKIWIETTDVFAWTLVVVILSIAFEFLIKYSLKRFSPEESQ